MRMLVTGGAGFIGSHLVDRLLAEGHEVSVVDDLSSGSLSNLAQARRQHQGQLAIMTLDICRPETVDAVVRARPEVVYHLAAQADVRVSVARPAYDAQVNLIGTLHVLEGARQAGASRVVFASSGGTIYGDPPPALLPLDESTPQEPVSPYGVAKKAAGDYLRAYRFLHDLEYCALALANVYGPRQDPHGEAGVVAIFARRLRRRERCTIFGSGEQTRDFVYVDDVVDAFCRAVERGGGKLLNVGTGVETSVLALYRVMAAAAGTADLEPVLEPARAGELDRNALDPAQARLHLGWTPFTSLDDGLAAVLESIQV